MTVHYRKTKAARAPFATEDIFSFPDVQVSASM